MHNKKNNEKGQIFVLLVMLIIGLLAIVGLAVDTARIFIERRRVQNAVDNSALAGALELCTGGTATSAKAKSQTVLTTYGYANGYTIVSPFDDGDSFTDNDYVVSVDLSTTIDPIIIQIIFTGEVGASAAAVSFCKLEQESVFNHAAYSLDDGSCGQYGINITGSTTVIGGGFHTNSGMNFHAGSAGAQVTGSSSSVTPIGGSSNVSFIDSPPTIVPLQDPSLPYSIDDFRGGAVTGGSPATLTDSYGTTRNYYDVSSLGGGNNTVTYNNLTSNGPNGATPPYYIDSSGNILPGVYYINGGFKLNGAIVGTATFVATETIKFEGDNNYLVPYYDDLLMAFSDENSCNAGISFTGNTNTFAGLIYAPRGNVQFSGAANGNGVEGLIVARTIDISGSSNILNYNAAYEPPPPPTVGLGQ